VPICRTKKRQSLRLQGFERKISEVNCCIYVCARDKEFIVCGAIKSTYEISAIKLINLRNRSNCEVSVAGKVSSFLWETCATKK